MQGSLPSLHPGNGKYTLILSRRLSIDIASLTGNTRGRSTGALAIDKVQRTEREATPTLSKGCSDADSVPSSKIASAPCLSAGFYRVIPFVGSRLGAGRPPAHRTCNLDGYSRFLRIHRIYLLFCLDAYSA